MNTWGNGTCFVTASSVAFPMSQSTEAFVVTEIHFRITRKATIDVVTRGIVNLVGSFIRNAVNVL